MSNRPRFRRLELGVLRLQKENAKLRTAVMELRGLVEEITKRTIGGPEIGWDQWDFEAGVALTDSAHLLKADAGKEVGS